jgi:predicted Rossmann-fold nucleotide-binding protein
VRLQLELLKPELTLAERGIRSTVVMFGGARLPEPGGEAWAAKNETQKKNLLKNAKYYDEARKFAQLCSKQSALSYYREFVVVTGGGPGVMEAGNRGAADVGAPSIGLNIVLPHERRLTSMSRRTSASTSTISRSARCTSSCARRPSLCFQAASARWTNFSRR